MQQGVHIRSESREPKLGATLTAAPVGRREHPERRVFDVEHTAQVEHYDCGLRFGRQSAHLFGDALGVEEEQPPFGAQEQQARERFILRMLGRARPKYVRPRPAAEHMDGRIRSLLRQRDDRHDRHQDPLQGTDQHHAEENQPPPR